MVYLGLWQFAYRAAFVIIKQAGMSWFSVRLQLQVIQSTDTTNQALFEAKYLGQKYSLI